MEIPNIGKDRKKRLKGAPDLSSLVYGKVPPQARDLEEAILGAIMLEKNAFDSASEILKPECFYVDSHQRIFSAMMGLQQKNMPIDILTVVEELRKREELDIVGGPYYVTKLTNAVVSSAHIETHCKILIQKFIQRELIRLSGEVIGDAYEDSTDAFDLLDEAESKLFDLTNSYVKGNFDEIGNVLVQAVNRIEELRNKKDDISGVPSGFAHLDRITNGFQPTDLIIIAARPSVGKTALALNLARNAAMHPTRPTPVGVFSLEMSNAQLVQRILSAQSEVMMEKISRGRLEDHEMEQLYSKGVKALSEAPIYLDDTPALNIFELRAKCRRMVSRHKVGLIIIDYLQLMSGGGGDNKGMNREQEISSISRALKGLAKELGVPVLALSQLSRAVESRKEGNKIPQLSDLRECVTGDTLVWLTDGRRLPIKDLVGKTVEVWCTDNNYKLRKSVSEFIWPVGKKKIYELKLASGRTLKASAEHQILTFEGWSTFKKITAKDRVGIIRRMEEPVSIQNENPLRLILLAHLIGDGSYLKGQPLRYTTASEENSSIVKEAAEKEFGLKVNRHAGRGNWHQLVFSGNGNRWNPQGLNLWLREKGVFGQRSHEKKIPPFVFTLSNKDVCLFLQHLWATDGTIYSRKKGDNGSSRIAFSTNSNCLANDVAALLLRLGIVCRIKITKQGKYRPMYSVDVSGSENQIHFLNTVGAFGAKRKQAETLLALLDQQASNTNVDTIPNEVFVRVKDAMKVQGITHRKMASLRGTSYGGNAHFSFAPSREVLSEYAEILADDELKTISRSDIFWDNVISMDECGEEEVFDLTVNETHNWLANGGIVTHNSGAIEQDADMVMFIYRPEYYEINQDEMGQSVKGETHIKIAKHRNGSLDTIKLKALLHIQKFVDWDENDNDYGNGLPSNFKPAPGSDGGSGGDAALYIQKPSKMNDMTDFDDGFDQDQLF